MPFSIKIEYGPALVVRTRKRFWLVAFAIGISRPHIAFIQFGDRVHWLRP